MINRVFIVLLLAICLVAACSSPANEPAAGATASLADATEPPRATVPVAVPSATAAKTTATMPVTTPAGSDQANADVLFVRAVQDQDSTWTFHVTVAHPDMGWEDYADGWDVVTPQGNVLKPDEDSPFTRLLLHPHDNEQPFTRSQSGIEIPAGITQVTIRAHDLLHGFGGQEVVVELTVPAGENYEVETP